MKTRFFLCYNVADTGERCREMSNGYREVQDLRKEDEHKGASLAKKKNRKRDIVKKYLGIMIAVCCVISMAGGCALLPFSEDNPFAADKGQEAVTITEDAEKPSEEDAAPSETPSKEEKTEKEEGEETVLEQADRLAAMYDYDSAISLLQEQSDYDTNTQMQEAVAEYEQTKRPVWNIRLRKLLMCSTIP